MNNDVTAIIATYNQGEQLDKHLPLWKVQCQSVIVVDDGSDDKEVALHHDAKYIWQEDKGFRLSASLQNGLEAATTHWVFFSDADSYPCEGLIDAYIDTWLPGNICVGPRRYSGIYDSRDWTKFNSKSPYYVSSSNMFCEREALLKIGGWHRGYSERCYLDWDVAIRWVFSKRRFMYVPDAIISYDSTRPRHAVPTGSTKMFVSRMIDVICKADFESRTSFMMLHGINQGIGERLHCLP